MPTVEQAVDDFLAQKRIAVAGVSRNAGGTHASNGIYTRLKETRYDVFPVNPNADTVMGDTCYRSLKDIPGGVDGVVVATNPSVSLSVAQECKELGINRVWFHENFGAGSYSKDAHEFCRANGITALVSSRSGTARRPTGSTASSARRAAPGPGPQGAVAVAVSLRRPCRGRTGAPIGAAHPHVEDAPDAVADGHAPGAAFARWRPTHAAA